MIFKKTVIKIYFILGVFFLLLAILGIILPLLPTTPFILLAVYFFDRSSKKFHSWCMKIPGFGSGIEDWQQQRIIRKKAKLKATVIIIISALIILMKQELDVNIKLATLVILGVILTFILTRSSKPKQ